MTVSSTTNKATYSGNGTTTVFTVPFYFLAAADLQVILRSSAGVETVQTLTTQYTVTGAGVPSGGSVTMLTAPPSGTTLTILRNVEATQETDLLPNDRLPAESLETALDKATMLIQQLDEEVGRSLKYPATDAAMSAQLPTSTGRASKFLSFDASGNPVATIGTDATTSTFLQAGAGAVTRSVNDKLREVISVKDFGAVGDGLTDDTAAIQNAVARVSVLGGGTLVFEPGKTYRVLPTGGGSGAVLMHFIGCNGVVIEGNGSKILTGSVTLIQRLINLNACSDVIIRNISMESGYAALDFNAGIDWIVATYGTNGIVLENIDLKYGRVGFVAKGAYTGEGVDGNRVRNIVANNLTFTSCYYPLLFQNAGDNFHARGIQTFNAGRSYFPANVFNHDVCLDSQQGGPFSDVLLKCYGSTDWISRLENIKLVYTSNGRTVGSGSQGVDEAMVAMDFQLHTTNPAASVVHNIDVTFNVEAKATDKNRSLFIVRKYDAAGNADSTGSRGHRLINLTLRGVGRTCENLLTDHIRLFTRAGENWAGEYAQGIQVVDFDIASTGSFNAVAINGDPLRENGYNCISRVNSGGNLSRSATNTKALEIDQASFWNYKARAQATQTYTCTWTGSGSNPVIGNGTLGASYTVQGKMCTVQISMFTGSTTTYGSGTWSFSLPFTPSSDAFESVGSALALNSGVNFQTGVCIGTGSATAQAYLGGTTSNAVGTTVPWTWKNGDYLKLTLTYPINN